jgi:hypothetical protein
MSPLNPSLNIISAINEVRTIPQAASLLDLFNRAANPDCSPGDKSLLLKELGAMKRVVSLTAFKNAKLTEAFHPDLIQEVRSINSLMELLSPKESPSIFFASSHQVDSDDEDAPSF